MSAERACSAQLLLLALILLAIAAIVVAASVSYLPASRYQRAKDTLQTLRTYENVKRSFGDCFNYTANATYNQTADVLVAAAHAFNHTRNQSCALLAARGIALHTEWYFADGPTWNVNFFAVGDGRYRALINFTLSQNSFELEDVVEYVLWL